MTADAWELIADAWELAAAAWELADGGRFPEDTRFRTFQGYRCRQVPVEGGVKLINASSPISPRSGLWTFPRSHLALQAVLLLLTAAGWLRAENPAPATLEKPAAASAKVRVTIQVFGRPVGPTVAAKVTVSSPEEPALRLEGTSKTSAADAGDHLILELPAGRTYTVETSQEGNVRRQFYTTRMEAADLLKIFMSSIPDVKLPPHFYVLPPAVTEALPPGEVEKLKAACTGFFNLPAAQQAGYRFPDGLDQALLTHEPAARRAVWEAFQASPNHGDLRKNFETKQARFEDHVSPYTVKSVGTKPEQGWGLFIAMHGGGGTTQEFNDAQWKKMQGYYRDHPETGGYLYVALRAPDNTWNGFYTGYAYRLMANLVQQFLLCGEVNPDKVFLMGYSHGGYGAFAMGPKMPDRFAAVHTSGAALADGAVADTLRNTPFICMIGEQDTAHGRIERCREFDREITRLRGDRSDIYPVTVQFIADHPHSGLPDRESIADMNPLVRHPAPRELTWALTDAVITDFYWLRAPAPQPGERFEATCQNNAVTVSARPAGAGATVFLDARLVDFSKPVTLTEGGQSSTHQLNPSLRTFCETMQRRGDPQLAFSAALPLPAPAK